MGQQDILEYLSKHPDEWFTAEDLKIIFKACRPPHRPLCMLRKNNDVLSKTIRNDISGKQMFLHKHSTL